MGALAGCGQRQGFVKQSRCAGAISPRRMTSLVEAGNQREVQRFFELECDSVMWLHS